MGVQKCMLAYTYTYNKQTKIDNLFQNNKTTQDLAVSKTFIPDNETQTDLLLNFASVREAIKDSSRLADLYKAARHSHSQSLSS